MDGATTKHQNFAGVGSVIRDELGRVVAAMSRQIPGPLGPLEVEAKAFEVAFNWLGTWAFKI